MYVVVGYSSQCNYPLLIPKVSLYIIFYFIVVRSKLECALMFDIPLRVLMPTNWNASNANLQPLFNISFPHVHYSHSYALRHYSVFKFTLALNFVLLFWKLSVFEILLGISESFLCSACVLQVKLALW